MVSSMRMTASVFPPAAAITSAEPAPDSALYARVARNSGMFSFKSKARGETTVLMEASRTRVALDMLDMLLNMPEFRATLAYKAESGAG